MKASRLQRLNLTSLELRRLHIDLVWCYKIVFGVVDVNLNDFFKQASLNNTRGHMYKLYKQIDTIQMLEPNFLQVELLMYGTICLKTLLTSVHLQLSREPLH